MCRARFPQVCVTTRRHSLSPSGNEPGNAEQREGKFARPSGEDISRHGSRRRTRTVALIHLPRFIELSITPEDRVTRAKSFNCSTQGGRVSSPRFVERFGRCRGGNRDLGQSICRSEASGMAGAAPSGERRGSDDVCRARPIRGSHEGSRARSGDLVS
jgi:hypothetical protein